VLLFCLVYRSFLIDKIECFGIMEVPYKSWLRELNFLDKPLGRESGVQEAHGSFWQLTHLVFLGDKFPQPLE